MAHKYVSNKATFKNEGFLSKLSSTLLGKQPPPLDDTEIKSSLKWHKTSDVKERIKTATGTIPVYADMSEEEVAEIRESVAMIPTLEESQMEGNNESNEPDVAAYVFAEAATKAFRCISDTDPSTETATIYVAIDDYTPHTEDGLPLQSGQKVELVDSGSSVNKRRRLNNDDEIQLLDNSLAKHKMAIRPKKRHPHPRSRNHVEVQEERWLVRDESGKQGMVPANQLGAAPTETVFASTLKRSLQELSAEESVEVKRKLTKELKEIKSAKIRKVLGPSPEDEARIKRSATIMELIETEEEFVKDLEYVKDNYYALFDDPSTPKNIRDKKEVIFNNFKEICEFHQNVLLEGVKYHAEVPNLIGKTFLRLERDFDMHSEYCSKEPIADEFVENNQDIRDFFEKFSEKISDDKRLQEHLKLPIQRLNDYQLLLKEIIKFSLSLDEETCDLERAHDLMQTIPQRATDAKFLASIEGYHGNLFKLGRLLRHDWFSITESDHKKYERYLFLFKARILATKVKKITEDRSVFVLSHIIRLPETSLGELNHPKVLELRHIEPEDHLNYPFLLEAKNQDVRDAWLSVIQEYVVDTASVDDLLFDDEIRVLSQEEIEEDWPVSPFKEDTIEDIPDENLDSIELEPQNKRSSDDQSNFDVWGDRISPLSPKKKICKQPEEAVNSEFDIPQPLEEYCIVDSSQTTKLDHSKVDSPTLQNLDENKFDKKEENFDFCSNKPSPIRESKVPSESESLDSDLQIKVQKSYLEDKEEDLGFWSRKESCSSIIKFNGEHDFEETSYPQPNLRNTEEPDFWSNEPPHRFALEETKEELGVWNKQDFSPPKDEFENIKEEFNLGDNRVTSPPFQTSVEETKEEDYYPLSESELKETNEESDFWSNKESSPPPKNKVEDTEKKLAIWSTKESDPLPKSQLEKTKKENELDFWDKKKSSPPPRNKFEEYNTKEEYNIWSEIESCTTPKSILEESKEAEELDFWSHKESSPPPEPNAEDTKEEFDIWNNKDSFPPPKYQVERTKEEVELDFCSNKESSELLSNEVEENSTREQFDTRYNREPSPPPKSLLEESTEAEDLDFWSNKEPSPHPRTNVVDTKEDFNIWSNKESSPPPKLLLEKAKEGFPTPGNDVEDRKEEVDFWNNRELSPPTKRLLKENFPNPKSILEKSNENLDFWDNKETTFVESETLSIRETENLPEVQIDQDPIVEEPPTPISQIEEETFDFWSNKESSDLDNQKELNTIVVDEILIEEVPEVQSEENVEHFDYLGSKEYTSKSNISTNTTHPIIEENLFGTEKQFYLGDNIEASNIKNCEEFSYQSSEVILHSHEYTENSENKILKQVEISNIQIENFSTDQTGDCINIKKYTEFQSDKSSSVKEETQAAKKAEVEIAKEEKLNNSISVGEKRSSTETTENKSNSIEPESKKSKLESNKNKKETTKSDKSNDNKTQKSKYSSLEEESSTNNSPSDTKKALKELSDTQIPKENTEFEDNTEIENVRDSQTMEKPPTPSSAGPKPVFTKSLCGDVVEPGDGATFTCEVSHIDPYYITWLKDNKVLDDKLADRIQQQDDGNRHKLKLLNCKLEDSGMYTAKATDGKGASAMCSAQLLVHELTEEEHEARIAEKKPFFLVKMIPTEVIENSKLSYAVHVKGDPMPSVKFYKDKNILKEDDRVKVRRDEGHGHYELLIEHILHSDAGVYKCIAMNKHDSAECDAAMTVADEQTALENLHGKGSLVKPGEKANFKWFRDGVEFDPLDRFNVMFKDEEDTLALVFQNVTPDDAGIYTCVASTSCGKISCSAELTVAGAVNRLMKEPASPKFEEELSDTYVALAGTAMLECQVSGYPKPELKWTHNGSDIKIAGRVKQLWEDEENVTLVIKNITEDDKGIYNVKAKNELGDVDSCANLIIRCAPKFRKFEKEVGCTVGQPLKYVVEIDGEPLPEVKWLKNGKEIPDTEREHITYEKLEGGKFVMSIDYMKPTDCGSYTITATNDVGQRSENFEILADTPPEITRGLDPETEKKANNDHTFEVRVSGSPSPTATWYRNGKEILTGDKFRISKDGQFFMLKIRNISRTDRGTYKIVVENKNGKAESEGEFLVRGPPEFTTPLKDACAKEGAKDVKMFVEWDANPRPTAKWSFKDKPIKEDTEGFTVKHTDTTSLLTIKNATPEFVGQYSVKLSNEYGDRSNTAKFRLFEPPQLLEPLQDVEFLEDTKCRFQCKASGVPVPEVKWTKDGKKWSPDETRVFNKKEGDEVYILQIDAAKSEDSGHYVATLSNLEGTVFTEATIIVNTPPHLTGCSFKEGKTFIAMHKFVLEVEADAVPEAVATWYLDGRELKEDEDSVKFNFDGKTYKMERIGSDPEHSGEYKCKLQNKIKEVEESGMVRIIEKEARVRQPLKNVFVKENMDGMIQCQIVGDPIPSVEWFRNGKPVIPSDKVIIKEDRENRMHYLTFKNIEEKDKSTFSLIGKNEHGHCETSCVMAVYVAPQPGALPDTVVDYGNDLVLPVHIHAVSPPTMIWMKNGKKLEESDRVIYHRDETAENYSLEIKSVVVDDEATYSFTASNEAGETTKKSAVKVRTEKPSIITEIQNLDICVEDEAIFSMKCKGLPPPTVEWRNKGSAIKASDVYIISNPKDGVHTLTIKNVKKDDYGMINAMARNVVGEVASTANLTQKKIACEVIKGLVSITKGGEGECITLQAVIRGSPQPDSVWTKDGDVVENSANIKLSTTKKSYCEFTISLTIYESSAADSGQYRLRFFNEVNEAQTETALILIPVKRKPKISSVSGDLCLTEMEGGIFKCKIIGYPKPQVTWMKDGRIVRPTDMMITEMTADGEYFLEFKAATLDDAGKYTVVASNEEGRAEACMNLDINPAPAKPKVLSALKTTKVVVGYPCRMEIQLSGFPKPQIAWMKYGKPVEIDGNHIKEIITEDGRAALQIDCATDKDPGIYSAVATNNLGEASSSAELSVLDHERKDGQPDGPPKFTEDLKDCSFDEGTVISLPISLTGGPVPDMKWSKDGEEIKLGERVFFTYDGDRSYLEIHPCIGADSGKYKCVLENPNGNEETECDVTVRKCFEEPSFTYIYPNQQQFPGMDAKFTIKVDGVPKPEISWYFNRQPIIVDGQKYRVRKDVDGCTLYVKNTTYSDSGPYKVVAKNREGQAEHHANLLVGDDVDPNQKAEAPSILKAIGDQELYVDYDAKFKAVVAGRPQPEFQWYKNGIKLVPNNRFLSERDNDGVIRLTVKHVHEDDTGIYELKVWNEHGEASCKGKLICECISKDKKRPVGDEYKGFDKVRQAGVPIPLSDRPFISRLSDKRCTLSWLPYKPVGPMLPVMYLVEMCESPEGDWRTYRTGIRGSSVDISDLFPKNDYKFRVRVENKFGISEPSPYVSTYRNRLERNPICFEPFLPPRDDKDLKLEGPFAPSGFRVQRDRNGGFFAPPRFVKLDYDTQYGTRDFSGHIKWIAYGYPTPKLRFYFNDKEILFGKGSRYTLSHEASGGDIYLFIDRITEHDVGWYKCVVHNEYGESSQRICLGLSEYPRVVDHLQETYIRHEGIGKIYCRITGYPPCDVVWFKDWHEIKPSIKYRTQFIEPDLYSLHFTGVGVNDSGLYSMAAVNSAGAVSSSSMVHVEQDDLSYYWFGHGRGLTVGINTRRGMLEDHYDIGDELGRGTQGATYHCVERTSGRNFAAKSMWGKDEFKQWMHMEFDMMNLANSDRRIARLYDAYAGPQNMVLVMELCAGGELLKSLITQQFYTEYEIAVYIRQVLEGLDYMHDRWIAHLGLNIGDIMLTHPNATTIRIGDLSLARNIRLNKLQPMLYGMPEFVAPEVVKGENVSYSADMWSVGIITYILLAGISPFRGENDRATLTSIQNGQLKFDVDAFANLSGGAKDFIGKLLQYKTENRMDVKNALAHPWLKLAEAAPVNPHKISTDRLKSYYSLYREWYANASCRRWYRRRTLASAFTHPSKMVYPPGEIYTPPETPAREMVPVKDVDYSIPHRDYSYELGIIKSESHYQNGPDTYLLQLRDTEFPVRLRKYMNLAREKSPIAMFTGRDSGYDYERIPIVHERRRFTDIMDEEIQDERRRRTTIDKRTMEFVRTDQETCSLDLPRRVKREITSRYTLREEAEYIKKETKEGGRAPFIREKPQTTAITPHMNLKLTCVVAGNPEPVVQWFSNDVILGDTPRIKVETKDGRSELRIDDCNDYDVGYYKVVARNTEGQVQHKFRVIRGEIPGMCDPPEVQEVSGTQIMLRWRTPIDDGGAPIEMYNLQTKSGGNEEWKALNDSLTQEFYLVDGLMPNEPYQFRISAKNIRGWGEFSISSPVIRTSGEGSDPLSMPVEQQLQQKSPSLQPNQVPGTRGEIRDVLDYNREEQPVALKSGEEAMLQMRKYKMVKEISRGRFSCVMKCVRHDDHRTFACKIIDRSDSDEAVKKEYEMAKSLRHERLATLYGAYHLPKVTTFIMDYLGGQDILSFLSNKLQYTEQNVAVVITQVLDAISYLHWRGFCHLDLQPDNVIVTSPYKLDVKLVDFGNTQRVDRKGTTVEAKGLFDFVAPEVLVEHKAHHNSDVWSIGVLTYVLLTGSSPFVGEDKEQTRENIQCVRYKFETLGNLVSQEATRFLLLIFKRDPSKRPTEEECIEHSWLVENDFMVKKRERTTLSITRLREYSKRYHNVRQNQASQSSIFSNFLDEC